MFVEKDFYNHKIYDKLDKYSALRVQDYIKGNRYINLLLQYNWDRRVGRELFIYKIQER